MFPCSDWATTPILENIPDSLGDIERVNEWDNGQYKYLLK